MVGHHRGPLVLGGDVPMRVGTGVFGHFRRPWGVGLWVVVRVEVVPAGVARGHSDALPIERLR